MVSLSDLSAPENVTAPVKNNIRKPFTQISAAPVKKKIREPYTQISAALHGKNDSTMTAEERTKLFQQFVRKKNGIKSRS